MITKRKFDPRKIDEVLEVLSKYDSKQTESGNTIYHLTTPSSYIQLGIVINDEKRKPFEIIFSEHSNTDQKKFEEILQPYLKSDKNRFREIYDSIRKRV